MLRAPQSVDISFCFSLHEPFLLAAATILFASDCQCPFLSGLSRTGVADELATSGLPFAVGAIEASFGTHGFITKKK